MTPKTLVWVGSTLRMNPRLDPAIVEAAYEEDAAAAAAEFGAQFRDDVADYINRAAVEACTARGVYEIPPAAGVSYRAACDPSGGVNDSYCLAIGHRAEDGTAVLDCIRERRPPLSPDEVTREFSELLRSYRISSVEGDRYAGLWPRERFAEYGIQYEVAERSASENFIAFLPLVNSNRCQLLDSPRLTSQLCSLERRALRGGRDVVSHPLSGHDDLAASTAMCLVGLSAGAGLTGWISYYAAKAGEVVERFAQAGIRLPHGPEKPPERAAEQQQEQPEPPAPATSTWPAPPPPVPPPPPPPAPQQQPVRGDTAWRASLPDITVTDGMVKLVASAPWARFFVGAPGGHGRTFTADGNGEIEADVMFLGALLQAGCRPLNAHVQPTQ